MKSKRSHEGWLYIDPGEGPAISLEEAAKVGGLIGAGAKGIFEAGILSCAHCQRQFLVNPLRTRERHYCQKCDHYVCDEPGCFTSCNGGYKNMLDEHMEAIIKRDQEMASLAAMPFRAFSGEAYYDAAITSLVHWDAPGSLKMINLALGTSPKDPRFLWHRGCTEMLMGRWAKGWRDKEAGLKMHRHSFANMDAVDQWHGEINRRVLVLAEQGMGDMLMMSRFLPWVIERSESVRLICHDPLQPLMMKIPGLIVTDSHSEFEYDKWVYADMLPRLYGVNGPLDVPPPVSARLRVDLPEFKLEGHGRKKVGLCWKGSDLTPHDNHRSMSGQDVAGLVVPGERLGVDFYGIHSGPYYNDLTPCLPTLVETAAALLAMDEVVTVDTATAHLAGSLGVKTHLLLSKYPEWRWPFGKTTTPWYKSVKIHWQKTLGDWSVPVNEVLASWENPSAPA